MDIYEYEVIKRLEEKLQELMGKDEAVAFLKQVCDEAFRIEIEGLPDSDFKEFVLGNFDEITKKWENE